MRYVAGDAASELDPEILALIDSRRPSKASSSGSGQLPAPAASSPVFLPVSDSEESESEDVEVADASAQYSPRSLADAGAQVQILPQAR